jgi:hypothetical protein
MRPMVRAWSAMKCAQRNLVSDESEASYCGGCVFSFYLCVSFCALAICAGVMSSVILSSGTIQTLESAGNADISL